MDRRDGIDTSRIRQEARRTYLKKRERDVLELRARQLQAAQDALSAVGTELPVDLIESERLLIDKARDLTKQTRHKYYAMDTGDDASTAGAVRLRSSLENDDDRDDNEDVVSDNDKSDYDGDFSRGVTDVKRSKEVSSVVFDFDSPEHLDTAEEERDAEQARGHDGQSGDDDHELQTELPASRPLSLSERRTAVAASLVESRRLLPVYAHRRTLLSLIEKNPVIILVGETGCGKTTQVPQYILEDGLECCGVLPLDQVQDIRLNATGDSVSFGKRIVVTQPRRIAAMAVAARVATEVGCKLGSTVGYTVRFDDNSDKSTALKFVTDGMLLREFMDDPLLEKYGVVMVDEAHERSVPTDIVLGLVKDLLRARSDLRVIVSSATIDAQRFSTFFDGAPVHHVPGRRFPVDVFYSKRPEANYLTAAVLTALHIHRTEPLPGDVLVFLTGQDEIEEACALVAAQCQSEDIDNVLTVPIYANLPSDMQARIFMATPEGSRKLIFATNIAETSITIEGVVHVVDCGFNKVSRYRAASGLESLEIVPVSKASADQRAGRAGRSRPGKCYRLYTKWSYINEMSAQNESEIQRSSVDSLVLTMKSIGIDNLAEFDFVDRPPVLAIHKAIGLLYQLGALNESGEITTVGRKMAMLPVEPKFSKALIAAATYKVTVEVCVIISVLCMQGSLFRSKKDSCPQFKSESGDHMYFLRIYNEWKGSGFSERFCREHRLNSKNLKRARDVYDQLIRLCESLDIEVFSDPTDSDSILKSFCAGFFTNLASLDRSGGYSTTVQPHPVHIHPSSCLFKSDVPAKLLLYSELVLTTKEFMRVVSIVRPEWVAEFTSTRSSGDRR